MTDVPSIFSHYLTSKWFFLDFFSILTSVFDLMGDESTEDLTVLRAVRTLGSYAGAGVALASSSGEVLSLLNLR